MPLRSKLSKLFAFAAFLALGGFPGSHAIAQKPRAIRAEATDLFLDPKSGPLQRDKVLELLASLAKGNYSKPRLIKALENRGVAFESSPDNVGLIRAATRDEDLFQLIKAKMHPYSPVPAGPARGSVLAMCQPASCEAALGGVTMRGGKALFENVPVGEVQVEFSANDYLSQKRPVTVLPGKQTEVAVRLELSEPGKLRLAEALRDKMLEALAAGAAGTGAEELNAVGAATLFDADGRETNWGINVKLSATTSTMELRMPSGAKTVFILECHGEADCKQVPIKKGGLGVVLGSKQAIDAEMASVALGEFRRFHFGSTLKKLSSSKLLPIVGNIEGNQILKFESPAEGYEVHLTPDFLISQVLIRSKAGLGDGVLIIYSDFESIERTRAKYPKQTVYRSGPKRGMKVVLSWGR